MPNWCENDLTIYHDEPKVVAEIAELISDENGEMTFDKIFPEPEELKGIHSGFCQIDGEGCHIWRVNEAGENVAISAEERQQLIEKHGADNLYDWCCNTYGTKWGACHSGVVSNDGRCIKVSFDTAWSPPVPVIDALAARFPTAIIIHEYFECGCAFQGGIRFNGDGERYEWSGEYTGNRGG